MRIITQTIYGISHPFLCINYATMGPYARNPTTGLFVSSDCGRIDSRKDRKFIEKCDSILWFACQREERKYCLWTPLLKTFPPQIGEKVGREHSI